MKEIVVAGPIRCPFRFFDETMWWCNIINDGVIADCPNDSEFPPGCPLFENDYLIKRRCDVKRKSQKST